MRSFSCLVLVLVRLGVSEARRLRRKRDISRFVVVVLLLLFLLESRRFRKGTRRLVVLVAQRHDQMDCPTQNQVSAMPAETVRLTPRPWF